MNTKNRRLFVFVFLLFFSACSQQKKTQEVSLSKTFEGKFTVGTAMNTDLILGKDTTGVNIIKKHFNSIVAENAMKSEVIQPAEGVFNFELSDKFVEFGEKNNLEIIGHTLIWHSQCAKWFFVDSTGADVTKDVLIERMKNHIQTVVGRYKGRIYGWDVVNESINDDGSWRQSKFYQILGEEYVALAFKFANEADPNTKLYYNDYSMAHQGRREGVVKMIKNLQQQGIRVDGVGMQGHITMDFPEVAEYEKSIVAFAGLGVEVLITELDLSTIPFPGDAVTADIAASFEFKKEYDPYGDGLSDEDAKKIHDRYLDVLKLFVKHHDKINRVTFWGISDAFSWKNNWPIKGRTDFPLLFDRNYQPKPIFYSFIDEGSK